MPHHPGDVDELGVGIAGGSVVGVEQAKDDVGAGGGIVRPSVADGIE
jgi:hypothetical protein